MRSKRLTMDYWRNWCSSTFGEELFPDTSKTNKKYGGVDLKATNLIITNGGEDPWKWASKL